MCTKHVFTIFDFCLNFSGVVVNLELEGRSEVLFPSLSFAPPSPPSFP